MYLPSCGEPAQTRIREDLVAPACFSCAAVVHRAPGLPKEEWMELVDLITLPCTWL